jgi:hypothetical protein
MVTSRLQSTQQVHGVGDVPLPAAASQDASVVHLARNGPQACRAARADVIDHRAQVLGVSVGVARDGLSERRTAPSSPPEGRSAVRLPSFTPRALAATSASLVRRGLASRFCSATTPTAG